MDILAYLQTEIQGGVCKDYMNILEEIWDEGHDITERQFTDVFDDHFFTCSNCGWTMPIAEMADNDNWECNDCED